MVLPVGPGKFYGSSLPRPWIYENVKYNGERVDPPSNPSSQLLSWAKQVDWSMGGLSAKRKRMQGKIEGNPKRLRALEDDDDDGGGDKTGNGGVTPDSEASEPGPGDALPANEGLPKSDEGTEVCSKEDSPRVRARAERSDEVVSSSSRGRQRSGESSATVNGEEEVLSTSGGPARRFSGKRSNGKGEARNAEVELVVSRAVESVRRSGRISGLRRGRE